MRQFTQHLFAITFISLTTTLVMGQDSTQPKEPRATWIQSRELIVIVPKSRKKIIAYSFLTNTWSQSDIPAEVSADASVPINPTVGNTIVACQVGQELYAYSSKSSVWAKLKLPQDSKNKFMVADNNVMINVKDKKGAKLYIFGEHAKAWSGVDLTTGEVLQMKQDQKQSSIRKKKRDQTMLAEFVHALDTQDPEAKINPAKAPKKVQEWLEKIGLPLYVLRLLQWNWPLAETQIGQISILSAEEIMNDKDTKGLLKQKFLLLGAAGNGDLFMIDFSTDQCRPGFMPLEKFVNHKTNQRMFFVPIARSLESMLYRTLEGKYVPCDYYAAKDLREFLTEEKKTDLFTSPRIGRIKGQD